jgi:hypothetical protein
VDAAEYCRAIETYLCRKNDGHLIRVVGPSFEIVSRWAKQGVPIKVAYAGIDRHFERYYRKGPRRRPVKIDFCEADVLDVFDEWRRAVGVAAHSTIDKQSAIDDSEINDQTAVHAPQSAVRRSLPAHLERVVLRLSSARASGTLGEAFDALIDRVAAELDAARASAAGLRGESRRALVERLAAADADLLRAARALLDEPARAALAREADEELAAFRAAMAADAYARAREAAIDRLVRERFGLPVIQY